MSPLLLLARKEIPSYFGTYYYGMVYYVKRHSESIWFICRTLINYKKRPFVFKFRHEDGTPIFDSYRYGNVYYFSKFR